MGWNMIDLYNKDYAFLFQGVGSDYREFLNNLNEKQLESLHKYCDLALKEINLELSKYLFNNSKNCFDETFNSWIAIYTIDCIIFYTYKESGLMPKYMIGYSMGLITAMTCGGSITYESGLKILQKIYEYPQNANRNNESMATIIGKKIDEVENIISNLNANNYVNIASENNEQCIVISGKENYIERILQIAENEGAIKAIKINTPYAIHSPYSKEGIEEFNDILDKVKIENLEIPVFSVFNQNILKTPSKLRNELIKNMYTPMNWKDTIIKIKNYNINNFVEVSLEDSLTKISRLIDMNYKFITYRKFLRVQQNANN
jgi:malonyl CoA-acyl carrier protein transacylase